MRLFLAAVFTTLLLVGGRGTPLDDYVNKPDPSYKYDVLQTERGSNYTTYYLNMTSQTWKPKVQSQPVWWHEMTIFIPDKVELDSALLLIDGGSNDKSSPSFNDKFTDLMRWIATSTNTVTAILKQVPNQPISFNNDPSHQKRKEDDIIAWAWRTFIKDNGSDPEILLRMPMTKAVVRGLDTIQDLVLKAAHFKVKRFMVTGASKRGWATWTTAAVDKRVVAFAPVVMDLLNLVKNLHHYYRSLGGWSYAFLPYYLADFTSMIDRPATQMIEDLVDPISYMERYRHKPKLIVSASGDEFFMIDDSKFYYDKLVGEKYLRMVPNADHKLEGQIDSVFHEIRAFYLSVMKRKTLPVLTWKLEHSKTLPVLTWKLEHTPRGGRITLKTDTVPHSVQVYHATTLSSKRKDFRMYVLTPEHPFHPTYNPIIWFPTNATQLGKTSFVAEVDNPKKGWTAFFIEVTYPGLKDWALKFTTETLITPNTYPFPDCHAEACRGHLV